MQKNDNEIIVVEAKYGTTLYEELTALRQSILRAPLGLAFKPEELATEKDDLHLAALDSEGHVVGSVLMKRLNGRSVRLQRMAVAENCQKLGVGRMLIERFEECARAEDRTHVTMNARSSAVGFYEKNGYRTAGKEFIMNTVPHIVMKKTL